MNKNTHSFHLGNIFAIMCRLVGADYNKIDTGKSRWYMDYSWDTETEKKFQDFLADYIHKMLGAQQELYDCKYMSKVQCERRAKMFILNYGWRHER